MGPWSGSGKGEGGREKAENIGGDRWRQPFSWKRGVSEGRGGAGGNLCEQVVAEQDRRGEGRREGGKEGGDDKEVKEVPTMTARA